MTHDEPPLPGILADIERIVDRAAALEVAARFGGTRIYVPGRPTPATPLVQAIGLAACVALAWEMGGNRADVPRATVLGISRTRAEVLRLAAAGKSVPQIARAVHLTERSVYLHLAHARRRGQPRDDARQFGLFSHQPKPGEG